MKSLSVRSATVLATSALLGLSVIAGAPANARPATTDGGMSLSIVARPMAVNDASITYKSGPSSILAVCRGLATETTCATASSALPKGSNSKARWGWSDTDAFWLPGGCTAKADAPWWAGPADFTVSRSYSGWVKTHGLNGGIWTVTYWC